MSTASIGVARRRALPRVGSRPELAGVLGLAAVLNLWGLSRNGWANTYYAAAVRSMATSWHDFLFASLDRAGLMTVDKPPAGLWVQALSVRIFGYHPLSVLVPQALMGVAAVGLTYDLVRRRFGRPAGCAAGVALALTPITVAISRHNNPDQLLILCCVMALWCTVRALEDGRTRWLLLAGACIGLGFETKMAVALFVVPGIAAAYLWVAPRGRSLAVRQLLAGGAALAAVALAWPLLVTVTPASDRPWISGTADNSIWSLIVGYNGVGRVAGQSGTPGGGGGGFGGGAAGIFRLLDAGLGGQAGWLLGFAVVTGVALVVLTRLRRRDPRTGWLIAVGGAFAVTAAVFSDASGIFHPYYVSFLAPWTAMLVGAGVGESLSGRRSGQIVGPLAVAGGAATELAVLGEISGSPGWAPPLVAGVCAVCALVLAARLSTRARGIIVAAALAALLAAPATWAIDTLGHATSSTFPAGGPASAAIDGPAPATVTSNRRRAQASPGAGRAGAGPPGGILGGTGPGGGARPGGRGAQPNGGMFGGDDASLRAASAYARSHGGGTIAVESQSTAASAILSSDAQVAGIGGFSGRESSVTAQWLATQVRDGKLRWLYADEQLAGAPGADGRQGSAAAIAIAERVGRKVTFTANGTTVTLYDLQGRAAAILAAAG